MPTIFQINGKSYLFNSDKPYAYMPVLPGLMPAPAKFVAPIFYGPPISAASLMKEDRTEEIADLGRLILNEAELAQRRAEAEHRESN